MLPSSKDILELGGNNFNDFKADLIEAADSQNVLVIKRSLVVDPLPHLGAANFSCGSILHEVMERHTAHAAQPGLQVLHPYADVVPQTGFGALPLRHLQMPVTVST